MQGSEQLIGIYHIGFIVCLILAIVFAGLSIFLFFYFRIRDVFNYLTGRAQKRSVQQMEEENAKTGKLRSDYYSSPTSSDLYTTPSGKIPPTVYTQGGQPSGGLQSEHTAAASDPGGEATTAPLHPVNTGAAYPGEGSEETTLLNSGSEETTLLKADYGETTLLKPEMNTEPVEEAKPTWNFVIKKEVIEIHTEEMI